MLRLLLATGLLLAASCASTRRTDVPLVVASDLDNRPFAFVDEQEKPRGRDVEMMQRIADELRRRIEWRRMPFAELLPAVERGEVDVVCATLGVTPERAQHVAFSLPYFETHLAVVVRTGPGEPRTLADLSGKRVAAGTGTTSERAVRLRLPRATGVFENKDQTPALERLTSLSVDAAVMDGPAAAALVEQSRGALARLAETLGTETYALALPKGRTDALVAINRALQKLEEQGVLRSLDARHALLARAPSAP
ncbi:MAG: ABC transporter substrate-binding protein [Planctomycetota bacterium]